MSWNDPALMLALRQGRDRLAREFEEAAREKELPSPARPRPAWPWRRPTAARRPAWARRAEKQPG